MNTFNITPQAEKWLQYQLCVWRSSVDFCPFRREYKTVIAACSNQPGKGDALTRFRKSMAISALTSMAFTAVAFATTVAPASAGEQACNSNTKTWVALYPDAGDYWGGSGATQCVGDKGTFSVPSNNTQVFCAGNNNGVVWYYDETTKTYDKHTFWNDTSYAVWGGTYSTQVPVPGGPSADTIDVYQVQITGWSGSAGC